MKRTLRIETGHLRIIEDTETSREVLIRHQKSLQWLSTQLVLAGVEVDLERVEWLLPLIRKYRALLEGPPPVKAPRLIVDADLEALELRVIGSLG